MGNVSEYFIIYFMGIYLLKMLKKKLRHGLPGPFAQGVEAVKWQLVGTSNCISLLWFECEMSPTPTHMFAWSPAGDAFLKGGETSIEEADY